MLAPNSHRDEFKLVDMHEIDEISLTLGKLLAGQDGLGKRIDEMDSKLSTVVNNMHNLPPSSECKEKHEELNGKIESLENTRSRNAGIMFAGGAVIMFVADWIARKLGLVWGG